MHKNVEKLITIIIFLYIILQVWSAKKKCHWNRLSVATVVSAFPAEQMQLDMKKFMQVKGRFCAEYVARVFPNQAIVTGMKELTQKRSLNANDVVWLSAEQIC